METIIETKNCRICSAKFDITDRDLAFLEKVSPVINGQKFLIPASTLCSECRHQIRLSYRNERSLYRKISDASGKSIVSMYAPKEVLLGGSPDKNFKVYEQSEWGSDKWEATDYGRDFDFSRSFFEQFKELQRDVPQPALIMYDSENSDYTNYSMGNKNCYLTFGGDFSEDCLYGNFQFHTKDSLDFYWISNSSNCYELINSTECNKTFFSIDCKNTFECYFCINSNSCKNCIGCSNLNNKEFYIFNKQSTKEEYEKIVNSFSSYESLNEFKKKAYDFLSKQTYKYAEQKECENSTGDKISNCNNCELCFNAENGEDSKDIFLAFGFKDIFHSTLIGHDSSLVYDSLGIAGGTNINFVTFSWGKNSNLTYCMSCFNGCSNLFGCFGLKTKEYCILNKQYTKEEYEILVPKIIEHMKTTGEWGEFFPASLSQFGYNETVAYEYNQLSKEEALSKGFNWSDYENPMPKVDKIIPASKLPDNISDIPDDIINWAIKCEISSKPFRIVKPELDFYRKHKVPIPRLHPDERHLQRMKLRNPMKLFERNCMKCGVDIKTSYSPERSEIIYCEDCFNKEMV